MLDTPIILNSITLIFTRKNWTFRALPGQLSIITHYTMSLIFPLGPTNLLEIRFEKKNATHHQSASVRCSRSVPKATEAKSPAPRRFMPRFVHRDFVWTCTNCSHPNQLWTDTELLLGRWGLSFAGCFQLSVEATEKRKPALSVGADALDYIFCCYWSTSWHAS